MASIDLHVQGMSCQGCALSVERRLQSTPGVESATVDLNTATARISFDEGITSAYSLEKVIESLGFDVLYSTGR